ncbi:interferon gamma [Polymixia lowei]
MKKTIESLQNHYSIPGKDTYNGDRVFSRKLLVGTMEDAEKRVFVGGVLEVYEKLIGRMLNKILFTCPERTGASTGSPVKTEQLEVGEQLCFLLQKITELQRHNYQTHSLLEKQLRHLGEIKIDDSVIQSKALGELTWMYQEASSLAEKKRQRRRRRRQAQRAKTPQ